MVPPYFTMLTKGNPGDKNLPVILLDIQYLPPVPYVAVFLNNEQVWLEQHENFVKQSFRNRCRILTANGAEDLVIPLKKPRHRVPVREIRIDNNQQWAVHHWKSIQSAYGKSPWFLHYAGELKEALLTQHHLLIDLDLSLFRICLKWLGMEKDILLTDDYKGILSSPSLDLRSAFHPKKQVPGLPGYSPSLYIQNFGKEFVPSMSIIDLIFSEGPNSMGVIGMGKGFPVS